MSEAGMKEAKPSVLDVMVAVRTLQEMGEERIKDNHVLAYRMGVLLRLLTPLKDEADKARSAILTEYAKRTEDGSYQYLQDGSVVLTDPEAFEKATMVLLKETAELPPFKALSMAKFGKGFPWKARWIANLLAIDALDTTGVEGLEDD